MPVTVEINCSSLLFVIRIQSCVFSNKTGVKASNRVYRKWNRLQFRSLRGPFRKMKRMHTFEKPNNNKMYSLSRIYIPYGNNRLSKKNYSSCHWLGPLAFLGLVFILNHWNIQAIVRGSGQSQTFCLRRLVKKNNTKVDNISLMERHSIAQSYCPKTWRLQAPPWQICSTRQHSYLSVVINFTLFWDTAPCVLYGNRRFGGVYHFHLQDRKLHKQPSRLLHSDFLLGQFSSMKMDVIRSPETSVHIYKADLDPEKK
jgi:hypothetical protein